MFNLYKQDGETLYGIKEFVLDTKEDLQNLPTNIKAGSSALIISTGAVYMLNGSKEWVEIGAVAANEGGSVSPELENEIQQFMNEVDSNDNKIIDSVELNQF